MYKLRCKQMLHSDWKFADRLKVRVVSMDRNDGIRVRSGDSRALATFVERIRRERYATSATAVGTGSEI
jgi:hypothetical protein